MTDERERRNKEMLKFILFDLMYSGASPQEIMDFCNQQIQTLSDYFQAGED